MAVEEKRPFKPIKVTDVMKKLMEEYYYELDNASKDETKKVAWCTSVGPSEILKSFGFYIYYPENHGAILGATRTAVDCIVTANAEGYSPDICSYLTSDIGSYLKNQSPLSIAYPGIDGPPKPDILVYNTNQCRDVQDWFNFYSKRFGVPSIGIETPRSIDTIKKSHIDDVVNQMKDLIPHLERVARVEFSESRLKEVVSESKRTSQLWGEILNTASNRPSPITFFDACIHMGPAVVLRGDRRANIYYELLLQEMKERVEKGIGAVDEERFRLYWEGMPVWGRLSKLASLFMSLRTCIVASTYCNSWVFADFDPENPFESMAKAYTELFIVRSERIKEEYIKRIVHDFSIDGVIFHDAKTCPYNSNNRYGMPDRLKGENIPTLTINGDLNDLRCFSDEQTKTAIEAFIEQLSQMREARDV